MCKDMSEVELAESFKRFVAGMDVYPEVQISEGYIDMVCVDKSNDSITIIEVKKTFNFKLLEQGIRSKKYANYVYLAIPFARNMDFKIRLCKDYGIGLIMLLPDGRIHKLASPKYNDKLKPLFLSEHQKTSIAGSQNDRVTSFEITRLNVVEFLNNNGGEYDAKLLVESVQHHYANNKSALNCLKAWIKKGIIKEFTFNNKKFILKK